MLTSTHWGTYRARVESGRLTALDPMPWDQNPSPIGQSLIDGVVAPCRVRRPAIREGFLRSGTDSRDARGAEAFVEVPWDEALDLVAAELTRVKREHGNQAIFGGSYGWSSAGRFHHAQSQVHRFLNCFGGYSYSVDTYSSGAARRVLPHVIGEMDALRRVHTSWAQLADNCEMFVALGGLPTRNAQVNSGGANEHAVANWIATMAQRGVRFVNISPVQHDLEGANAEWLAARPGSDTALLLALCYVVISERLYDQAFLDRYTVGFDQFRRYVLGQSDDQPKTPEWAAPLVELPAERIALLAREMAARRTMLNIAWSLQRAEQGEQPFWASVSLAALLGQIGTPGGGLGLGYSCTNDVGSGKSAFSGPRLPQGRNPVKSYIPVARIADMLRQPGEPFQYDGRDLTYPDIRLVYWAGGNIFHHHQDINRLIEAWRRPEVVIVNEQYWTAQAKHADIVLPATTSLERDDIGSSAGDGFMVAMKKIIDPVGEALDDHEIFRRLSDRLGIGPCFSEGRDAAGWLRALYDEAKGRAVASGFELPDFDAFWEREYLEYPVTHTDNVMLAAFRKDPGAAPLPTPSGRIELYSREVAGFGYEEAPGHAYWQPPQEWLGNDASAFPLHMLTPQPATRLHSQYDHGSTSRHAKIAGREPMTMNPQDAAERGIAEGDVVRVFNDRGQMLCGITLSDGIRPGVVSIATGAWYDPDRPGRIGALDKHGNPNVLTQDVGTSRLGQGCAAQSALVEVERFNGPLPEITAFEPPAFARHPRHEETSRNV